MPDQTFQIGTGETYTTIAAWEAASDVSSGFWKGELKDASEYNENVTISAPTGTPTSSNYIWLSAAAGVRHAGKADTTHARVRGNTNGSHVFTVSESFTRIENLEIQQDSTGSSDEGVRFTSGVADCVMGNLIVWGDTGTSDQDGLYAGDWAVTRINVYNCIIYGFGRAGIHAQNHTGSASHIWNVDYCTIDKCGASGEDESGGINAFAGNSATVTINVYNTGCLDTAGSYSNFSEGGGGTINWTGTNNACTDFSLTDRSIATNAQEGWTLSTGTQSSGTHFVVNSLTSGSEDYQLFDNVSFNKPYAGGVGRVGSEPDSRQDFSVDIVGNARSTTGPAPDIGASEYTASGVSGSGALSAGDATAAGSGTITRIGTGALACVPATMSGSGKRTANGSGALICGLATMIGLGSLGDIISGTGSLSADAAALSGSGIRESVGSGSLACDPAGLSGVGSVPSTISGAGTLIADNATLIGYGGTGETKLAMMLRGVG